MVGVLAFTPSESKKVVMTGDLAQERLEEEDQNIIEGEVMKVEDERVEKDGSQMKDQQNKKSLRVLLLIISLFGLAPVAVLLKVQDITSHSAGKD
jgi:hypothetical protein